MSKVSKLSELRAKTDRELIELIGNELQLGFHLAVIAGEAKRENDFPFGEQPRSRAEQAYAEARRLLPKVEDVSEHRRLEEKLNQLREALDRQPRVQAAYP
jgi:hypothetical protein